MSNEGDDASMAYINSTSNIEKTPTGVRVSAEELFSADYVAAYKRPGVTAYYGIDVRNDDQTSKFLLNAEERDAVVAALDPEAAKAKAVLAGLVKLLEDDEITASGVLRYIKREQGEPA